MKKGRIHSFENFGTVDGPGIRFVVFMQGCPLRCIYCHNPDTWEMDEGELYTASDILKKVEKFIPYFRNSGGGITVSGGEPLMQEEFVTELFRLCKEKGIHTALDTSGFSPTFQNGDYTKTNQLLSLTDLVLLDVKHLDDKKHNDLTGLEKSPAFEYAKACISNNTNLWLRYVLVPGLTDFPEDLKNFGEFTKSMKSVEKVEFLAFHKLGEFKWNNLNIEFPLSTYAQANDEDIDKAYEISGLTEFK